MMTRHDPIAVGDAAAITRTIEDATIRSFAEVTGDRNPVHLDEAYASETAFRGRIAHGMLVASLISEVLGTKLPGPGTIYLGQHLKFHAPVRPGDEVTARVEVVALVAERGRITMSTTVTNQRGEVVISGEASLVMADALKK
jgi:acyl dehydratase